MIVIQCCPVCEGRGFVPAMFYATSALPASSSTANEKCRTCSGVGVLRVAQWDQYGGLQMIGDEGGPRWTTN